MKRIISVLLVAVMLCAVIPFSNVFAATPNTYSKDVYNYVLENLLEYAEGNIVPTTDPELPGKLVGQEIDISSYSLSEDQAVELMQDIADNEPMLFYMDTQYYIWQMYEGAPVIAIQPLYLMDETDVVAATKYVNEQVEKINSTLPKNLDDFETALYFYEYIALNFDYDHDYEIYDIYEMFKNGIGVCQAYTLLYDELLTRNGIDNRAAVSKKLVHMWNEIKLDGSWYQVDITWGDYEDPFNRIDYDYFLMSNTKSASLHNNATDIMVEYDCTDTLFDNISWKNYTLQYAFAGGEVYGMDEDGEYIQKLDLITGETEEVFFIGTENNEYFMDMVWETFSHLGSYDERLIYNSGSKIMYYDPATEENKVLYTATEGAILQMTVFNGVVTYSPKDTTKNTEIYYYIIDFSNVQDPDNDIIPPNPEKLYGDVNLDGVIDKKDYAALKRFCFGTVLLSEEAVALADVNHDGEVDKKDYALVKRHCFGTFVIG